MKKGKKDIEKPKKQDHKDEHEPKVAFNGTFEDLIDIVAPPVRPVKKKE